MALGRIRRNSRRVAHSARRAGLRDVGTKTVTAKAHVTRTSKGGYTAYACVGRPPNTALRMKRRRVMARSRCGRDEYGSTPQSAIAKAFKSLSSQIARRGKRL